MTVEESDPQKELLYEKLSELPDDDQELYRRYYIEEYSQEEIEKMKGVSQNTIFKKLRRIKNQLTEMCRNIVVLLERTGTEEKTVSLYIKFNKLENSFVIVISFHEQKHPLTYYFK